MYSFHNTSGKSVWEATSHCDNEGGYLASFANHTDMYNVGQFVYANGIDDNIDDFWVAGFKDADGQWYWRTPDGKLSILF